MIPAAPESAETGSAPAPSPYVGRFAPSPTGLLHAGSLVAALASWLDARAHGGRWLVRIEDVDLPRCVPGADTFILEQLARCGLVSDAPVVWQSHRHDLYEAALHTLAAQGHAYPCACSRAEIMALQQSRGDSRERHGERVYPGTCRPRADGQGGLRGRTARAWRLAVPSGADSLWHWQDRRLGPQRQDLAAEVGDFVIRRADGLWAYQLAVVVDDARQGITDIVRGEDLADNTPRQQWLAQCLGLKSPRTLHTPLVLAADGQKLSKQNGARALAVSDPVAALNRAAFTLGLETIQATFMPDWLAQAVSLWAHRIGLTR